MSNGRRENEMMKKKYGNSITIDSEEFYDVSYHIEKDAIRVMIFAPKGITQFAGTASIMRGFARELLEVAEQWG